MQTKPRSFFLIILTIFFTFGFAACTTTVKPVYILRHAERGYGSDPDLTTAGQTRAEELKRILKNVPVTVIYSTDTNRTRQTAQPLADDKNLNVQIYSGTAVADTILAGSDENIYVVLGHSETVPQLITAFGGTPPYAQIPGNEFDNLFLLIVKKKKTSSGGTTLSTRVLHMKYGSVTN